MYRWYPALPQFLGSCSLIMLVDHAPSWFLDMFNTNQMIWVPYGFMSFIASSSWQNHTKSTCLLKLIYTSRGQSGHMAKWRSRRQLIDPLENQTALYSFMLVGGFNPSEKYESPLGWVFQIYGKIANVPNHKPELFVLYDGAMSHSYPEAPRPWHARPNAPCVSPARVTRKRTPNSWGM